MSARTIVKRYKRKFQLASKLFGTLALLALTAVPITAQDKLTSLQKVQGLNLPTSTNKIKAYFSPGYEKRALEARTLLEEATAFFEKELKTKVDLTLALLNEEAWRKVNESGPYGVPYTSDAPHVVFLPATDDNAVTVLALSIKDRVPRAVMKGIEKSGLTYDEAARKFVTLIGLHELGHTYTEINRIHPGNKWFSEFLATYHAHAFLSQRRPQLAKLWQAMNNAYAEAVKPTHVSLEDFERLYFRVGIENYAWYQGTFQQMVARVYSAKKLKFLTEVRASFPRVEKGEDWLQALLNRPTPVDVTLRLLEKINRGFIVWAEGLR